MIRLIFILGIYVIIPGIQALLYIQELPFIRVGEALNYIFSILTFYAVFNHVLITVKIPRFQKFFPYDKMVKIHALSGFFLALSIYYHGLFKIASGKIITLQSWILMILWTFLMVVSIAWISTPFTNKLRTLLFRLFPWFEGTSYDLMKALHGYLFILFGVIAYFHVSDAGFFYSSSQLISLYGTLFPLIVLAIFLYSKVRKLFMPKLRLVERENAGGTYMLTFEPMNRRTLKYKAGQFGYLKRLGHGLCAEEHPFSFLSAPADQKIMMGIKDLGDYTKSLNTLEPGDTFRINGGFGNFIPRFEEEHIVLIGSGIGIVPLVSLVKDLARRKPGSRVTAFFAVDTREELLLEQEFTDCERKNPNLKIHVFVYQEDGILYSADLFKMHLEQPEACSYYICSSPSVRKILIKELNTLGVKNRQMFYEAFSY